MLQEINETSFMVNDLTLYLDTHPLEEAALLQFQKAMEKRKELLKAYAEENRLRWTAYVRIRIIIPPAVPDMQGRSILRGQTALCRGKEGASDVEL